MPLGRRTMSIPLTHVLTSLLHYLFFTLWMVEFPLSPGRSAPDPEIVGFGLVLRLHRGGDKKLLLPAR